MFKITNILEAPQHVSKSKLLAFIKWLSEDQNFREGRIQFLRCIESLRARVTTDRLQTIVLFEISESFAVRYFTDFTKLQ